MQQEALLELLRRVHPHLSVLVFTGFSWDEVQKLKHPELLEHVDILLAGRYQDSRRVARGLLGSSNKTIHFLTPRYSPADLADLPEAEIVIDENGTVTLTGIDPVRV